VWTKIVTEQIEGRGDSEHLQNSWLLEEAKMMYWFSQNSGFSAVEGEKKLQENQGCGFEELG
jgi:hypothetical protein